MAMLSSPNPNPSGFSAILPVGNAMMPIRKRWIGYRETSKQKLQSLKSEIGGSLYARLWGPLTHLRALIDCDRGGYGRAGSSRGTSA